MRPTKANELIKSTASELNLPEEVVADVVNFYYTCVKNKIESLEYPTIFIHGLGTLRLSRRKLKKDIEGLERMLSSNSQNDFRKVVAFNLNRELLEQKRQALNKCNDYYNILNEKRSKNLEKQGSNT